MKRSWQYSSEFDSMPILKKRRTEKRKYESRQTLGVKDLENLIFTFCRDRTEQEVIDWVRQKELEYPDLKQQYWPPDFSGKDIDFSGEEPDEFATWSHNDFETLAKVLRHGLWLDMEALYST